MGIAHGVSRMTNYAVHAKNSLITMTMVDQIVAAESALWNDVLDMIRCLSAPTAEQRWMEEGKMVTDREKLFNLIGQVQDCGCDVSNVVEMNYVENNILVDYLIDNGVTVQGWIPVTERLPELWTDVLAFDSVHKEIRYAYMAEDAWVGVRMNGKVTHWMPLPEPPKEE